MLRVMSLKISNNNTPHGFCRLTPYFTVAEPELLIEFIVNVFNAELLKKDCYEDGRVQHARLQIKDSLIMVNQETEDYPSQISQMHLYVDDLHTCFKKALSLGATPIMTPNRRPHGVDMAGFLDPCGNRWWIAQPPI